jgi:hypothetical protein
MFLRLVLVGMVATMGLTLPSRWGCEHWLNSAGSWASSSLAEWDTWSPNDVGGGSHGAPRRKTECPECRLARERVRLRAETTLAASRSVGAAAASGALVLAVAPLVADSPVAKIAAMVSKPATLEPIEVAQRFTAGIASVLSELPRGLDASPKAAVAPPERLIDDEPIVVGDQFELAMLAELCRAAESAGTRSQPQTAAEPTPADDTTIVQNWICGEFVGGFEEFPTSSVLIAKSPEREHQMLTTPSPAATKEQQVPGFCFVFDFENESYVTPDRPVPVPSTGTQVARLPDIPRDVFAPAAALAQVSVKRNRPATTTVARLADLPRDVFAPPARTIVVDRGQMDGHKLSETRSTNGHDELTSQRWGNAVRLTRDAVYAWMSVLTKPGLVDVAHR